MKLGQKIESWLLVFFWASLIFTLSSIPTLPNAGFGFQDFVFKKSAHVFVYFILMWLTLRASGKLTKRNTIVAFTFCFLYAISDEVHQSFVPGRGPRITDVGFDTIGIAAALKLKLHAKPNPKSK